VGDCVVERDLDAIGWAVLVEQRGRADVCAAIPCFITFHLAAFFPASVTGPVDFLALRRFSSICAWEAIAVFLLFAIQKGRHALLMAVRPLQLSVSHG
jgi:hypothetical protein